MATLLSYRHSDRTFEGLYRAHAADVYRYALALTGNPADAEDVAQTAFMNAYRALARGERPQKPHNWLIAITHNVCRQRFRHASRRPPEVEFEEDVAEAVVPSDDTPTGADLQRALGHLALNQRAALVMRELEGRSYAEIAEVLGVTVAAVETLIFRARRALREQLEGSLTCSQAEAALSLQMDGELPRSDAGQLRAHLRECETCRRLAKSQRAQRKGFKALAAMPLPPSLASAFGGGATTAATTTTGVLGGGLVAKTAALVATAAVVSAGGYAVVKHETATQTRTAGSNQASALAARPTRPASKHSARPAIAAKPADHRSRRNGSTHMMPVQAGHAAEPGGPGHVVAPTHPSHPARPAHAVHPAHAGHHTTRPNGAVTTKQAHTKSATHVTAKKHKPKAHTRLHTPHGRQAGLCPAAMTTPCTLPPQHQLGPNGHGTP